MMRIVSRLVSCLAVVLVATALVAAQSGTPRIGGNPPPEPAQNPVPPQNAKNAPLTTVTGKVSDSYCRQDHYMLTHATDAECVRYCIAHNGNYVVIAGNKIYTLHNVPGHTLESLSDKEVRVTGWLVRPDMIEIQSVTPAGSGTAKK